VRDVAFLRAQTDKPIRITIPGPFTMIQQLFDEHYHDEIALAMDCAAALNDEIKDLFAAGADVVQLDEPFLQAQPDKARRFAIAAIDRALQGVEGTTAVHLCFGYAARVAVKPSGYSFLPELEACKADQISIETAQPGLDCAILSQLPNKSIILGVLDLGDMNVESAETVAARVRRALPYVSPERIILAPDCGMKYLPRDVAFGKLTAMAEAAAILRREVSG
jgi:5-methyltetrahydropteroyltriglutamate--homocysteine methyltransferase